jgi:hypothetical protein
MIKTNRPPLRLAGEGWGEGGTHQIPLTFILSPLRLCRNSPLALRYAQDERLSN